LGKAAREFAEGLMIFFGLPYSGVNEVSAMFKDGEFHPEAMLGRR
jgi:hypothetical protein